MAAHTDADCEELFEASRTYSDEAFCMSREGKISEDEEFAYRVQKTYADVGVEVSKEEAKQFEERYRYYQKHIQVPEITKQILDYCKENYRIASASTSITFPSSAMAFFALIFCTSFNNRSKCRFTSAGSH